MAESWRSTPEAFAARNRDRTSSSERPSRSPSAAYGAATSGKSHWTAFSSSASTSSVTGTWSRVGEPGRSTDRRGGGRAHGHDRSGRGRAGARLAGELHGEREVAAVARDLDVDPLAGPVA